MDREQGNTEPDSTWFVGATFDENVDQTPRFVREGIWENGHDDKYLDLVRSTRPGDRIAIKSSYTRKHDLEFDNRENSVSVMPIKAVGTITGNMNYGQRVRVDWKPPVPPREWYFYANQKAVWRVVPGDWRADGLLRFTFDGKPREIDRFRRAPLWRERFGALLDENRFLWTGFYEDVADQLLEHREDRWTLIEGLHRVDESAARRGWSLRWRGLRRFGIDKVAISSYFFPHEIGWHQGSEQQAERICSACGVGRNDLGDGP